MTERLRPSNVIRSFGQANPPRLFGMPRSTRFAAHTRRVGRSTFRRLRPTSWMGCCPTAIHGHGQQRHLRAGRHSSQLVRAAGDQGVLREGARLLASKTVVCCFNLNANPSEGLVGNIWGMPIDERELTPRLFLACLQFRDDSAKKKR